MTEIFDARTAMVFTHDGLKRLLSDIHKFHAQRILIVYAEKQNRSHELLRAVIELFNHTELSYELSEVIVPDLHLSEAYAGIALGKRMQADFVLAIGGSAAINTAKEIALGLTETNQLVSTLTTYQPTGKECLSTSSVLKLQNLGMKQVWIQSLLMNKQRKSALITMF